MVSLPQMTYRRLFLHLLAAGTLVLAGLWWFSLRRETSLSSKIPPVHCDVTLRNAVIAFSWYSPSMWRTRAFAFDSQEAGPFPPYEPLEALAEFSHVRHPQYFGTHGSTFTIPLWFPWFLFCAAVWLGCRFMERRAVAGKERVSAGIAAAAGNNC